MMDYYPLCFINTNNEHMQALATAFNALRQGLSHLLDRSRTAQDLRTVAMAAVGGYLAWYRLLETTTGADFPPSKLQQELRAYLGDTAEPKGAVEHVSALFASRQAVPVPPGFAEHYRVNLRLELQREVARDYVGKGSLVEHYFPDEASLEKARRRIIRKEREGVLEGKFSTLVFYDEHGAVRRSTAAIHAAVRTLQYN